MSIMTPMKVAAVLAFLLSSCGGATDELAGGVGSNTNWLSPCADGDSCAEGLTCLCGVCTTACSNAECAGNTECVVPSHDACAATAEPVCVALCASDASCVAALGAGFACVVGRCEARPASGAVSDVMDPSDPAAASGSADTENRTQLPAERIVEIGSLTNSPPPAECVRGLPPLLPGCDPNVIAYSGIDCDADGVPDHRLWRCEVASAERPPEFGGGYDCEPGDPGLRYWVTADADGDGFGDGQPLCAGPSIPQGYIALDGSSPSDCNDHDSAVYPEALETWGDGVDSDCSSDDGPRCDLLQMGAEQYVRAVPTSTRCDSGPDLFLSPVVHCGRRCPSSGAFFAFVGNAGTIAAPGPIGVLWSDDTGAGGSIEVSPGALAPGETTAAFALPTNRSTHTEISIDFQDCDAENGRFVDDNPSGNLNCL